MPVMKDSDWTAILVDKPYTFFPNDSNMGVNNTKQYGVLSTPQVDYLYNVIIGETSQSPCSSRQSHFLRPLLVMFSNLAGKHEQWATVSGTAFHEQLLYHC